MFLILDVKVSLMLNKILWVIIEYSKSIVKKYVFYNLRKFKDLLW